MPVAPRCSAQHPPLVPLQVWAMHRPPVSRGALASRFPLRVLYRHRYLRSHPVRQVLRSFDTPHRSVFHRLSPLTRSLGHFLPSAVSRSPNFNLVLPRLSLSTPPAVWRWSCGVEPQDGLGRRWELHSPAPFATAPALLEARGYSVCLWCELATRITSGVAPRLAFRRVWLQFGDLPTRPSVLASLGAPKAVWADRRACGRQELSPPVSVPTWPVSIACSYFNVGKKPGGWMRPFFLEHHYVRLRRTKPHCKYNAFLRCKASRLFFAPTLSPYTRSCSSTTGNPHDAIRGLLVFSAISDGTQS